MQSFHWGQNTGRSREVHSLESDLERIHIKDSFDLYIMVNTVVKTYGIFNHAFFLLLQLSFFIMCYCSFLKVLLLRRFNRNKHKNKPHYFFFFFLTFIGWAESSTFFRDGTLRKHKNIFVDNAERTTLSLFTDFCPHHFSLELFTGS